MQEKINHNNKEKKNILDITKAQQYKTVDELFKKSEPNSIYYTLLILSSFIVACGLLLENSAIIIGGMLVTPILTPVLTIALGLAVGEIGAVKSVVVLIVKSFLIVIGGSLLLAVIFGAPQDSYVLENTMRTAVLYFIVAFATGIAATFAWVRKEVVEILPGVAIAVSLVPPLSLIGIWLSVFNLSLARFYFLIFFFNLLGLIMGSLIVFVLLKFYKTEKRVQEKGI